MIENENKVKKLEFSEVFQLKLQRFSTEFPYFPGKRKNWKNESMKLTRPEMFRYSGIF